MTKQIYVPSFLDGTLTQQGLAIAHRDRLQHEHPVDSLVGATSRSTTALAISDGPVVVESAASTPSFSLSNLPIKSGISRLAFMRTVVSSTAQHQRTAPMFLLYQR
jgi:hypothetical protein